MKEIVNFLFEVGMLQKTPRSGFQFLGSGDESVAEHILRTLYIAYALCKLEPGVDEWRVMKLCLFHDLPEARTGDMNYVNKKYVEVDEEKAVRDLTQTLFFGDEIKSDSRGGHRPGCRSSGADSSAQGVRRSGKQVQQGMDCLCRQEALFRKCQTHGRVHCLYRFHGLVVPRQE